MCKYRMNAMAAFAVNIEIEASSRNEAFEKYDQMREKGELPWKFVDTMDVNCDKIETVKLLRLSGFAPGATRDPEGYVRRMGIEYVKFLGYNSMSEDYEFLVDEFPEKLPKYFSKIEA